VKIVNTADQSRVLYLREQSRPVKHVSFDLSGTTIAASCTDGIIYMYSLSSEQPQLIKRVDGMIGMQSTDSEASTLAVWHPDGRAFVVPTQGRGEHIYHVA
jgi:chromosome transmission fidelity protein 4